MILLLRSVFVEPRWHFVTPHGLVLLAISHQPDATLRELARAVGLSERWVTKIVGELVEAGYVTRHRQGTSWLYGLEVDRPMRHRLTRELDVRRLLMFLDASEADEVAESASDEPTADEAAPKEQLLAAADRRLELRQLDAEIARRRAELLELEGRCGRVQQALEQAASLVGSAVEGRLT